MDWFKIHHGLPYDARLAAVARRSGLKVAEAVCLFICLMEHASRSPRRGSVDGFDCELPAALFRRDVAKVEAAMAALRDKGMINDENRIADWERQGVTNTERQRDYRARKKHAAEAALSRAAPDMPDDPDSDAETLARRKRLSAQAVARSAARRHTTQGTAS